jgi:hypothetical protein
VLQRARTDIKKPIEKIEVYRGDHARAKGGNRQKQGDPTTFEVCKQNAWWMLILRDEHRPAIIMEHSY